MIRGKKYNLAAAIDVCFRDPYTEPYRRPAAPRDPYFDPYDPYARYLFTSRFMYFMVQYFHSSSGMSTSMIWD